MSRHPLRMQALATINHPIGTAVGRYLAGTKTESAARVRGRIYQKGTPASDRLHIHTGGITASALDNKRLGL